MNRWSFGPWAVPDLGDFAHLDVDDVVLAEGRGTGTGLAALVPIGAHAEGPALDACNDVQHPDGDGCGHHEDEGHGHPANCEDQKQYAANDLCKCVHIFE